MDTKELQAMADIELQEKERQLKQEIFNLRFQLATGRIENPMKIRQTRRDLARVKTVLTQKMAASRGRGS
ncbi:MAG TPA: 50S ribosomal protein L29 [Nitrospiraceae bacterium]|jgi:large subunit ribosomal protein L29|nr:50S ribosomal protein L29 [Nitrospiraceae bacterium]